jgi:hypothetical protein
MCMCTDHVQYPHPVCQKVLYMPPTQAHMATCRPQSVVVRRMRAEQKTNKPQFWPPDINPTTQPAEGSISTAQRSFAAMDIEAVIKAVQRIRALCWTVTESLDKLVKKRRLDQELCHELLSLKDLVLGLHQIQAQALQEFYKVRFGNYEESSRWQSSKYLYLLEHAVVRIQVCCALQPLLQLKLRHPSGAVCVWISRRSDTFAAGCDQARRLAGDAAGRGAEPAGPASSLLHARQAQRRSALGHRAAAGEQDHDVPFIITLQQLSSTCLGMRLPCCKAYRAVTT